MARAVPGRSTGLGAYDVLNNRNVDVPRLRQALANLPEPQDTDRLLVRTRILCGSNEVMVGIVP
ncbi:hypothetical protein [Streptomyces sp. NPDC057694]|uniref:hypothetical protein n=1 Tax=Streptomyces sp. NPDC057694 TaxID=3346216 RepID=UPI00367D5D2A